MLHGNRLNVWSPQLRCKGNKKNSELQTPVGNFEFINYILPYRQMQACKKACQKVLFLGRLHVGVHRLNVVEVLKFLDHLVDGFALLGGHVLQVVGDARELGTRHLEAFGF